MTINVLFFASLKEELGLESMTLDVHDSFCNRAELLELLQNKLGRERIAPLLMENVAIAVNQTIEKADFTVQTGDEVAFLPPITGG